MKQWAQIILSFSLFLQRKISAELKHQLDNAAPKLTEVDIVLQGSDTEVHPWHQFSWLKRSVCVCVCVQAKEDEFFTATCFTEAMQVC